MPERDGIEVGGSSPRGSEVLASITDRALGSVSNVGRGDNVDGRTVFEPGDPLPPEVSAGAARPQGEALPPSTELSFEEAMTLYEDKIANGSDEAVNDLIIGLLADHTISPETAECLVREHFIN